MIFIWLWIILFLLNVVLTIYLTIDIHKIDKANRLLELKNERRRIDVMKKAEKLIEKLKENK